MRSNQELEAANKSVLPFRSIFYDSFDQDIVRLEMRSAAESLSDEIM